MEPQFGQIVLCGFTYAQDTTLLCNGALLPISANYELFALLGTQYGGDGRYTFALPNLPVPAPLTAATASWQITAIGNFPPYDGFDAYLGELDLFGSGPTPNAGSSAYAPAQGQLLPISPNTALFSLLGTTFGGNGTYTFALPSLAPPSGPNTVGTSLAYGICWQPGIYPSPSSGPQPDSVIGTFQLFAYPWVPFNYLPCNGKQVTATAYPALHSVIGNAFGGSGSTFAVPNLPAPAGMQWGIVANGVMPSNVNET